MVHGSRFTVHSYATRKVGGADGTNGTHETYLLPVQSNCERRTVNGELSTFNPDDHLDFYQCVPG